MEAQARYAESPDIPPSSEDVKSFACWLESNGVSSTYEHEGLVRIEYLSKDMPSWMSGMHVPFPMLTHRLYGVSALDRAWDVRLGVFRDSPSGKGLSVSSGIGKDRIEANFDPDNGEPLGERSVASINAATFRAVVAAFQGAPLEEIKARTIEKWGRFR